MNHAGLDLVGNLLGTLLVFREDCAAQAVVRVVSQLDGFFFRAHGVDLGNWAEEFVVVGLGTNRYVCQHSWAVVRSGLVQFAAGVQLGAFFHRTLYLVVEFLRSIAGRQWVELALVRVEWIARLVGFCDTHHLVNELVVDIVHDDDALVRGARLTSVVNALFPSDLCCVLDIIRVQYDVWVSTAQLKHALLQCFTCL